MPRVRVKPGQKPTLGRQASRELQENNVPVAEGLSGTRAPVEKPESLVTAIRKGDTAVDPFVPNLGDYHVLHDPVLGPFEAVLNQTNLAANNNKFYLCQLLQNDKGRQVSLWFRWGRVGNAGQTRLTPYGHHVEGAKEAFLEKFLSKTGNAWEAGRQGFVKVPGKYDWLEKEMGSTRTARKGSSKEPPSRLDKRLQELVKLIFNLDLMEHQMAEIGFDSSRMPLGALTTRHLEKGWGILRDIETQLRLKPPHPKVLLELSSAFYTLIPHDFGRNLPPVLRTAVQVKEKLLLLEALREIRIATRILAKPTVANVNSLDAHYDSLGSSLAPVPSASPAHKLIATYLKNTHAPTHTDFRLNLLNVFEVEESSPLVPPQRSSTARLSDRKQRRTLLWHGSRLSNFVGILSHGLQTTPKDAPITGIMFGGGIYFADMATKSAQYVFATSTSRVGLLLLCEVALGESLELLEANENAEQSLGQRFQSVKGCGGMAPDPSHSVTTEDGVLVPCGQPTVIAAERNLLYNEYIVYLADQVQIRYVVKVEFDFH